MKDEGHKNMFSSKKMKADEKKRKRRLNRKKFVRAIGKCSQQNLDKQLVRKTSSTDSQSQKMELDLLILELKLLKDAYEKLKMKLEIRKLHANCILFQNQNLNVEVQKGENKSTAAILYENKILKRDNVEVELSNSRDLKEEYVEYVEKDSVKSEPIDQDKVKNEPLLAERMKIESKPCFYECKSTRQTQESLTECIDSPVCNTQG